MKGYLQSTTVWGLLVLALNWLLGLTGIDLGPAGTEQLVSHLVDIFGWALALYGRTAATTMLSGLWQRPDSTGTPPRVG